MDVTRYITWFLFCLFVIPQVYVFPGPLGGLGAPAAIFALGAFAWWFLATLYPGSGLHRGPQPIRIAMFVFIASITASLAIANRGEFPADQVRLGDRGLLLAFALAGIALLI